MLDADEGILTPARLKACWDQTFYDKQGERRRFCQDETQNGMIVSFLKTLFQKARVMLRLDRIPTQALDHSPAPKPAAPKPD